MGWRAVCILAVVLAAGLALATGCDREQPRQPAAAGAAPPNARLDMVRMLREDDAAPRHPGDGGGRAWLRQGGAVAAGTSGTWRFVFEAGPEGIAEDGWLFFQVSPFWDWSTPQVRAPEAPGYTTVETDAEGVGLDVATVGDGLLGIRIEGRALPAGARVDIGYGVGPAGARADRYAERGSTFWFAVDADGDGIRRLLDDCPSIDVHAGPAAMLVAHVPSVARVGETIEMVVAALDARGNAGARVAGALALVDPPPGVRAGPIPALDSERGWGVRIPLTLTARGVHRLRVRGPGGLEATSNPLEVDAAAPAILWADLHGHSGRSDGTGLPEDYLRYARDVAGLDVVSLTDHDHWGMRFLDRDAALWDEVRTASERFHDPGRFVTIPGFEWTSWIHGHRHVLYFDGRPAEMLSSLDPATEHPEGLWRALDGRDAITIAHHTAGGPIATNWDVAPDPRFEPVTEVVSVHGSSEAEDSPARIYSPVPGHFARDALDRGYRLGFVGSGDSHDGHPGLAHFGGPTGGLAALITGERTRAAVAAALRARRVYATSGARIVLRFGVDETPMGGTVPAGRAAPHALFVRIFGTAPLERIDLVRSGAVVGSFGDFERMDATLTTEIPPLAAGEYVYVRALQRDGHLAWSSPIFAH